MRSYRRKRGESAHAWLERLRAAAPDALSPAEVDELTRRLAEARAAAESELSSAPTDNELLYHVKGLVRRLSRKGRRELYRWIRQGMDD